MFLILALVMIITFTLTMILINLAVGAERNTKFFKNKVEVQGAKKEKLSQRFKKLYSSSKKSSLIRHPIILPILVFAAVWFILKNLGAALLVSAGSFIYPKMREKERQKKRKDILNIQFRDALQSVSNSLKSGNSLTKSLERCLYDMQRLYKYQLDKPIIDEWEIIVSDLRIGRPVKDVLRDFQNRAMLEDVDTFVNAVIIINEKGGNLTEVLSNVAEVIGDRIEVKRDIMTLTAGKRMEAKMLTFMPIVLVGLLSLISPDYMKPMFDNFFGKLLASLGVIMLLANYFIGKQIIDIEL